MPKRSSSAIGVQLTQQQRSSSYKSRKSHFNQMDVNSSIQFQSFILVLYLKLS